MKKDTTSQTNSIISLVVLGFTSTSLIKMNAMKKIITTLVLILSLNAAFAQPCSLTNLVITVKTGTDGKCYAEVKFDMDRNNGNKFVYVHIWNMDNYAKVNKNRWKKGAGPLKNDIDGQGNGVNGHPALATIAINNTNYSAPVFSSYGYRPDPSVTARTGSSVTVSSTPVSGTGPHAFYRYTISKVLLGDGDVENGCATSNVCGIVWSTQANSQNSHIHCSYIGCNTPTTPLTISGNADCALQKYSLTITNNTTAVKQATFDIYADNSGGVGGNPNGIFDPLTDTKFDSGYFAVNGSSTFTINRSIPAQYLNFDLWAQVTLSDGTTQLRKLTTSQCGPLPVTLSALSANRMKQNVSVKWSTSSEQNVKGFGIERLTNGSWESVAFVSSKSVNGNSSSALSYEFTDANDFKGISQYRLRVIDLDNRYKFSDIKTVKGELQKSNMLIYPNPGVDGKVNVLFEESNIRRNISIVDISGRTIKEINGTTNNKIMIDNLRAGMHILKVTNLVTGETETQKIIIAD